MKNKSVIVIDETKKYINRVPSHHDHKVIVIDKNDKSEDIINFFKNKEYEIKLEDSFIEQKINLEEFKCNNFDLKKNDDYSFRGGSLKKGGKHKYKKNQKINK